MLTLGLTGSIATGKSTVSSILSSPPYSLPLIDADILAREVVEPGKPAYLKVVREFADKVPDLLLPASTSESTSTSSTTATRNQSVETETASKPRPLNRAALSRAVFGPSAEATRNRKLLNSIIHPAVQRALTLSLINHYLRGAWAVIVDVPLLFEAGLDIWCGVVVVVGLRDVSEQVRRLRDRSKRIEENGGEGVGEEEARERVGSQMGVLEKVARGVWRNRGWDVGVIGERGMVVWNDEGLEELKGEVERVYTRLRQGSPVWWTRLCWFVPPVGVLAGLWTLGRNWWDRRAWDRQKKKI